jgi:hypothetical protein
MLCPVDENHDSESESIEWAINGGRPIRTRNLFTAARTPRRVKSQRSARCFPGKSISRTPMRIVRSPWPGTPGSESATPSKIRKYPKTFRSRHRNTRRTGCRSIGRRASGLTKKSAGRRASTNPTTMRLAIAVVTARPRATMARCQPFHPSGSHADIHSGIRSTPPFLHGSA